MTEFASAEKIFPYDAPPHFLKLQDAQGSMNMTILVNQPRKKPGVEIISSQPAPLSCDVTYLFPDKLDSFENLNELNEFVAFVNTDTSRQFTPVIVTDMGYGHEMHTGSESYPLQRIEIPHIEENKWFHHEVRLIPPQDLHEKVLHLGSAPVYVVTQEGKTSVRYNNQEFEITPYTHYSIGTAKDATIRLDTHEEASEKHAYLFLTDAGMLISDRSEEGSLIKKRETPIEHAYAHTMTGKYKDTIHTNEDSVYVNSEIGAAIICDGAGGHKGAAEASRIAMTAAKTHLEKRYQSVPVLSRKQARRVLNQTLDAAQRALDEAHMKDPELSDMHTTFTMSLTFEDKETGRLALATIHIGDSRAYLIDKKGQLHAITQDHNEIYRDFLPNPNEQARLQKIMDTAEHEKDIPPELKNYWEERYIVLRSLSPHRDPVRHEPDIFIDFLPSDIVALLLVTDGVHDNVSTRQMENVIHQYPNQPERLPLALAQEAYYAQGFRHKYPGTNNQDDVSNVLATFKPH